MVRCEVIMKKQPPSVNAVLSFYEGNPDGVIKLLGTFLGRGIMLSLGYKYLSNSDDPVRMGFLGSAIIETYLLWYFSRK